MIEFSCSCGKKYRLPDRNAEREVRCNQCEKTLIVPKQSQTEPVVPVGQPEIVPAVVEPKVEPTASPVVAVSKSEPIKPIVIERKNPFTPTTPPPVETPSPVPADASQTVSLDIRGSGMVSCGTLAFLLVALIGVGIVGVVLGRFSIGSAPPEIEKPEAPVAPPPVESTPSTFSADEWTIGENTLPFFEIRTADGARAELSLDGDPTAAKTGKKSTLDEIAVALDDDHSSKKTETHSVSLRIDSESAEELCVVWPKSRNAGLDEAEIKELKFCVYFSGAVKLADFRLRLGDGFGDTEFVLAEKDRNVLCEKGRITWYSVSVPIDGNDRWQRTERGRMTPRTVDFIEFRARPTGNGVSFWIDNLAIVHP